MCACFTGEEDSAIVGIQIGTPWTLQIVLFNGIIDARDLLGWAAEATAVLRPVMRVRVLMTVSRRRSRDLPLADRDGAKR